MTDNQDGSGRQPPPDDRTLLDPLGADELKALREARERMKAKKGGGSAVAHQIVIGPDSGEDIGDAPTRAMPALPTFEGGNVSLDQINQPKVGGPPSEPMSIPGGSNQPPPQQPPGMPPGPPGQPGVAGPTGFGENTLLWMSPPKVPVDPTATGAGVGTGDLIPKSKDTAVRRLKAFAVMGIFVVVIGMVLFVTLSSQERGVIEVHTNPPKADITIDGKKQVEKTPVKLTLEAGPHEILVELEGHRAHKFTANVEAQDHEGKGGHQREDIDLHPISKPGLMTVAIKVQPVSSNIVVDETVYASKRSLLIPNLDPKKPHKVTVEAGGYVKIEQEIAANQLKAEYSFVLQKDDNAVLETP